jgi:hypothetical protein
VAPGTREIIIDGSALFRFRVVMRRISLQWSSPPVVDQSRTSMGFYRFNLSVWEKTTVAKISQL